MRVSQILAGKRSGEVVTVAPDLLVRDLVAVLAQHDIGAVVVSGDGSTVEGIVSERDVVRRLHQDDSVMDSPVSSIMTREVHTVDGDQSVTSLMVDMTQGHFRHVPVVADGRLTGIVSIGDLVKSRISELEFERDQLDTYVHGVQG